MKTQVTGRLIGNYAIEVHDAWINDGYHKCELRQGYYKEGDGWACFTVTGERLVTTYSFNTEEECDALITALNK